jgi:DNA-binding transcriptional regulator YiaG
MRYCRRKDKDKKMVEKSGEEIREFRSKMAMTQEELAHQLGVTVSTVNRWENGHTKPSKLAMQSLERIEMEQRRAVTQPAPVGLEDFRQARVQTAAF